MEQTLNLCKVPEGLRAVKEILETVKAEMELLTGLVGEMRTKADAFDLIYATHVRAAGYPLGVSWGGSDYVKYRIDDALRIINEKLTTEEPPVPEVDPAQAGLFDETHDTGGEAAATV